MLKSNKKFVVANWKMNFSQAQAIEFCNQLVNLEQNLAEKLIIAPPKLYLGLLSYLFPKLALSAQDVSAQDAANGAFTGEVSAQMLVSSGVKYVIIGHYERRSLACEQASVIMQKAKNCLAAGLVPIICFGDAKKGDDILSALHEVYIDEQKILYAYEPYWAIGKNHTDLELITNNIAEITNYFAKKDKKINLLYGGSVNSQNIVQLSQIDGISGFLIGGASLNFDHLLQILKSI